MDEIERLGQQYDEIEALGNAFDQQKKSKSLGERTPAWLLGLGQFAEDSLVGSAESAGEMEVDVPDFFKPERIKSHNKPQRMSPSLNLEQYVDPEKMGQFNAGRYGPAVAALGLGGAAGLKQLPKLTNRNLGNKIVNTANKKQMEFGERFQDLFNKASNKGVKNVTTRSITPENYGDFSKIAQRSELKKLQDFINNPTAENAHWAQSDLGAFIRRMEKQPRNVAINDAIESAQHMKKGLVNSIKNQFKHKNAGELYDQYSNLRNSYRTDMAPFRNNQAIHEARLDPSDEKFMEAFRLPSKLGGREGDSFRRMMGDEFPELFYNRLLAGPAGKAALGYGAYKLYPTIVGEH